jgi:vanillate monooxygenase ferredoxin subunit
MRRGRRARESGSDVANRGQPKLTMQKVRIRSVRIEAADIRSLELVSVDDRPLAPFNAGAHVDVHVNGLVRQYSLINTTDTDGSYRIAVKLEPNSRGGSQRMHTFVEGETMMVGLPRNNFKLRESAAHSVLLAGGIGVTPLLGMAYQLQGKNCPFSFDYFARAADVLAFAEEIRASRLSERTRFHLGLNGEDVGKALADRLRDAPRGTHAYACGPAAFMQAVRDAVSIEPGVVLHLEYFAVESVARDIVGGAFRVKAARSGTTVQVEPGQTIVEALRVAGIVIETSCEQGVCGTCLTPVLAGRPDHRDMLLTDEERAAGAQILPCVSRSLDSELVLDL